MSPMGHSHGDSLAIATQHDVKNGLLIQSCVTFFKSGPFAEGGCCAREVHDKKAEWAGGSGRFFVRSLLALSLIRKLLPLPGHVEQHGLIIRILGLLPKRQIHSA
jgi:hypothetical protein